MILVESVARALELARRVPVNAGPVRLATPGPNELLTRRIKTRRSATLCLLLILLSLSAGAACADDSTQPPVWRVGGFGTVGAGHHGSDGLTYRRDLEQAGGHQGSRLG